MADLPSVSAGDAHPAAHNAERTAINANTNALTGKIDKPSSPVQGNVIRYNGSAWTKSAALWLEGTSSPEGSITAPVGSIYIRTDGAAGGVFFVKTTGSGNTGWTALKGDTGWRNVLAAVDASAAGAAKYAANLRRIDNLVTLYLDIETPNANGQWNPYNLPSGFRPAFNISGGLKDNNENAATTNTVESGGAITMATINGSKRDRWYGSWFTDNNWPGSLPGTAL